METTWFSQHWTEILAIWLVSQIVLFIAKKPLLEALQKAGAAFADGFKSLGGAFRRAAQNLREADREVLIARGKTDLNNKIAREHTRLEELVKKQLQPYPEWQQRLNDLVTHLETDVESSGQPQMSPPGWSEAVQAVTSIPDVGERSSKKILGEIKNMAVRAEQKASRDFAMASSKQHRILSKMAPIWRSLHKTGQETWGAIQQIGDAAGKLDAHVQRHDKVAKADDSSFRLLSSETLSLFLISTLVLLVAIGGAFVNFQLIALPMSELVPAGTRVAGAPVSAIAAMVIVLMEAAAGIFLMEALGVTDLFPRISQLTPGKRRLILGVSLFGLFFLASIEASLAVLREQIVASEIALKQAISGQEAVETAATSMLPVIGQAALGFVLPWILAMVAIPLEMVVQSGRHVLSVVLATLAHGLGYLTTGLGHAITATTDLFAALFHVYVALPSKIESLLVNRKRDTANVSNLSERRAA